MSGPGLYLEDLLVGQRFTSRALVLERERVESFAAEFDPQPFHLDPEAGRASIFGGQAASGWHTASATMRLMVESVPIGHGLIGLGVEVAWPRPARPDDTLRVEIEIVDIVPSRSKPDRGVVTARSTARNQNGEIVCVVTSKILVFRREAS